MFEVVLGQTRELGARDGCIVGDNLDCSSKVVLEQMEHL